MSEENKRFFEEFEFPNYDDWKNAAVTALKGVPFDKVMFTDTYEGIQLKPIYNKEDLKLVSQVAQDFPGYSPFNRGSKASGYKLTNWEISQSIPYPLPEDFNSALKSDLKTGQNSIRLNAEKAAVIHEDFTAEDFSGANVCISNISDLKKTLADINLSEFPVNIDAGVGAFPVYAALATIAKEQNSLKDLKGSLNFDFITELAKEGNLFDDLSRFTEEQSVAAKWSSKNTSKFKTIGINAAEWHNSGANAVQESAVAVALGVYYINELLKKDMTIDEIAPQIIFSFAIGVNFFMEIAKFRALRIIWSKVIEEFGGNSESQKMFIHAVTSERELTKIDPYVNILRSSSQVFSAVAGCCDSITVNNFDKSFGQPNDFSRRVARNTQNVIKYESHLDDTIDPAAGSYYIENLTNELIKSIWDKFLSIEENGGIVEVLKSGSIQNEIEANFKKRTDNLASRKDVIVGVNKYANIHEHPVDSVLPLEFGKLEKYVEDFDKNLAARNSSEIDSILDEFENIFSVEPLKAFELACKALDAGAGFGELYNSIPVNSISKIDIIPLILRNSSEEFENIREIANNFLEETGNVPNLNFVCLGALRDWKARADFSNDFFAVGGFSNKIFDGNITSDDAISKLDFTHKQIIVVCSTDVIYSEILIDFAQKVKKLNQNNFIILAGYPKDMTEQYKNAGVDMFIHVKSNIIECLKTLYNVIEEIK